MEEKDLKKLRKGINSIKEEWWHRSGKETFMKLGKKLVDLGVPVEDTIEILDSAYYAVANEYGD